MIKVLVEYLLRFREITGKVSEEVVLDDNASVNDLLNLLRGKYGGEFSKQFTNPSGDQIAGNVLILLNGRTITEGDLHSRLRDGDKVTITYAILGG